MTEFNVLINDQTKERAYYVDNIRFDRVHWRELLQRGIAENKLAIMFVEAQIEGIEDKIAMIGTYRAREATFEVTHEAVNLYREMQQNAKAELIEARHILAIGQQIVEEYTELLED